MRADRLLSILLMLQHHGRMTAREIAARLEVSERTVLRDMEALSAAGVPVVAERGSHGGWYLAEGYRTNLTGLKKEEILSLLLVNSSRVLADLGMRKNFEAAFLKLLAALPAAFRKDAEYVRQRIHVDGAGWHQSGETFAFLPLIQEAVWEERKLAIRYQRHEDAVERIVDPLGLVAKGNTWYLVAAVDGEFRSYRVSRVLAARKLDERFARPESFDLAAYWERSTAAFKAKLPQFPALVKIDEKLLPRMQHERYARIEHVRPDEDGWLVAEVCFETLESACELVLGYGPHIEVLQPDELRAEVIAQAKAIVAKYAEPSSFRPKRP